MIISIQKHRMHFKIPFKVAYEEKFEDPEVALVSLTDSGGCFGLGSASPDTEVTGETVEGVLQKLSENLTPDFFDAPLQNYLLYHEKIQAAFAGFPSAQNAAEEALLNLWCMNHKVQLSHLFGRCRTECPLMISIGLKEMAETEQEIKNRLAEGFTTFKLKVGLHPEDDLARIQAARKLLPPACRITLDANQGYSFEEAKRFIKNVEGLDIAAFEQPIDAHDIDGLKALHHSTRIPLFADESAISAEDALRLMRDDCVSGVNIKLMKCGGPLNFIKIFHATKTLGKLIMIGCMYESNVSITTGTHLALALPIDFVDLDSGHLDFDDDPVVGGAVVRDGRISIGDPLKPRAFDSTH